MKIEPWPQILRQCLPVAVHFLNIALAAFLTPAIAGPPVKLLYDFGLS
jgi:hypothetical protein